MEKSLINNEFYNTLHEDWYTAQDHPIALLRAESSVRTPWIVEHIHKRMGKSVSVLDIGCGGGLLTNSLAQNGHRTTGVDVSQDCLDIAFAHDETKMVNYVKANAYELPFEKDSFDVVCATDILEHVERPERLIQEASRVLRNDGLFFFHTFSRNLLSYLLVIKGVEWFVKNTPPRLHVYHLFIKPSEIQRMCSVEHLVVDTWAGLVPQIWSRAFWKLVVTKEVPKDFSFRFVNSLSTGYCGIATKVYSRGKNV